MTLAGKGKPRKFGNFFEGKAKMWGLGEIIRRNQAIANGENPDAGVDQVAKDQNTEGVDVNDLPGTVKPEEYFPGIKPEECFAGETETPCPHAPPSPDSQSLRATFTVPFDPANIDSPIIRRTAEILGRRFGKFLVRVGTVVNDGPAGGPATAEFFVIVDLPIALGLPAASEYFCEAMDDVGILFGVSETTMACGDKWCKYKVRRGPGY